MDSFKDFFTKKRHQKPILGGTDLQKKHVNVMAAKYKADNTLNHKIETLKKQPGKFICDANDLEYIQRVFLHGRPPNPGENKLLGGKLGINFFQDKATGQWIIQKQ